jgi:hypothetical protein
LTINPSLDDVEDPAGANAPAKLESMMRWQLSAGARPFARSAHGFISFEQSTGLFDRRSAPTTF